MKNLDLTVYKWNDTKNSVNVTDVCTNIRLYQSHKNVTSELEFAIAYNYEDYYYFNFEIGDIVQFVYKGAVLFCGKVLDTHFNLKSNTHTFTCYDLAWWLMKCNITVVFDNPSVKAAILQVFDEIEFPKNNWALDSELGSNADIIIGTHIIENQSADKVLMAIMQEVSKQTGIYYYIHLDNKNNITITECDKYYSGITIQKSSKDVVDGNLIDYDITRSMQNVVNQIKIYDINHSKTQLVNRKGLDSRQYGIIQDTVNLKEDDDENKAILKAQNTVEEKGIPSEEVIVKCLGDVNYKVGYGVMTKIPYTTFFDKFMYIIASEWQWCPGTWGDFVSTLTLSSSKHKDLTDFVDIETKNEEDEDTTGDENGGQLVQDIITELKRHLGKPYVWGATGPDSFDCSGYIGYCYNKFASQLEITSDTGSFSRTTYTMMNEGKDVTSSFKDSLKPCDIIFPSDHHVVAYIGDGKVIHSPQTGDVVKISDIYFSNVAKVIRVVPDSAFQSKKSSSGSAADGISSQIVEFIKGWEGYVSHWDNSSSYGAIGYGTDASGNVGKKIKSEGVKSCTESQATEWLMEELKENSKDIDKRLNDQGISLTQQQKDCLLSMCYNMGINNLDKYILPWVYNQSSSPDDGLMKVTNGGLEGLVRRREAEIKVWKNGDYSSRP